MRGRIRAKTKQTHAAYLPSRCEHPAVSCEQDHRHVGGQIQVAKGARSPASRTEIPRPTRKGTMTTKDRGKRTSGMRPDERTTGTTTKPASPSGRCEHPVVSCEQDLHHVGAGNGRNGARFPASRTESSEHIKNRPDRGCFLVLGSEGRRPGHTFNHNLTPAASQAATLFMSHPSTKMWKKCGAASTFDSPARYLGASARAYCRPPHFAGVFDI